MAYAIVNFVEQGDIMSGKAVGGSLASPPGGSIVSGAVASSTSDASTPSGKSAGSGLVPA